MPNKPLPISKQKYLRQRKMEAQPICVQEFLTTLNSRRLAQFLYFMLVVELIAYNFCLHISSSWDEINLPCTFQLPRFPRKSGFMVAEAMLRCYDSCFSFWIKIETSLYFCRLIARLTKVFPLCLFNTHFAIHCIVLYFPLLIIVF